MSFDSVNVDWLVDLWSPLETFINIFKMTPAQAKIFAAQTNLVQYEEGGGGPTSIQRVQVCCGKLQFAPLWPHRKSGVPSRCHPPSPKPWASTWADASSSQGSVWIRSSARFWSLCSGTLSPRSGVTTARLRVKKNNKKSICNCDVWCDLIALNKPVTCLCYRWGLVESGEDGRQHLLLPGPDLPPLQHHHRRRRRGPSRRELQGSDEAARPGGSCRAGMSKLVLILCQNVLIRLFKY